MRAFQAGRYAEAIARWSAQATRDAELRPALAEAHFRRALAEGLPGALADLRRAHELAPDEQRYQFHLGRMLHRSGDRAGAAAQYRALLSRDPSNAQAAQLLALLTLEEHLHADLSGLPGMTPELLAWAAPAQALIAGRTPPDDDSPLGRFWRGLDRVAAGDPAARELLADDRPLPAAALHRLRRYYRGAAAALAGDTDAALKLWEQTYSSGGGARKLAENLAVLLQQRLEALIAAGDEQAAAALAREWAELSGGVAFDELRIQALDRGAYTAASAGDWAEAVALWEAAREILGRAQGLGSPRPILHNLALAYERLEEWEEAAEAWRGLLRTRPRRADAAEAGRWAWVRKRIIECYRNAGRPDEAVTVFRQAIKAEPNDLDLRVQLADALMANQQERAAYNEIKRILQIEPHHPEALLRQAAYLSERWEYAEAEQIARGIAERHPDRPDLRREAAAVFLHHGRQHAEYGHYQRAYDAFVEGERYDPENPLFPINQARMLPAFRPRADIAPLIERALTIAGDNPETWVRAIETWAMHNQIDAARALIERFEAEMSPGPEEYVALGGAIFQRFTPPPAPLGLFRAPARPKPVDTPWTGLALELLDRAVDLRPDDAQIPMGIATLLLVSRPDLACRFADMAAQRNPDNPDTLILLGLALGLDEQVAEAKSTLQRAAQMARRQGKRDTQEQAQEMRRLVGTPFLRSMIQAGLSGDSFFDDDFDDEDLEDW